ncbi:hypothetical protein, partial [Escherichia coli]
MDRTIKPETPKSELASTFNPAAGGMRPKRCVDRLSPPGGNMTRKTRILFAAATAVCMQMAVA